MAAEPPQDWPSIGDAELAILRQLWHDARGLTVRALHDELGAAGHDWAYTTVQTMLLRLAEKGYVDVDRREVAHRFRARVSQQNLLDRRLGELADKYGDGQPTALLLNLVERHRFTADEIARFRRLLDDAARREDDGGTR